MRSRTRGAVCSSPSLLVILSLLFRWRRKKVAGNGRAIQFPTPDIERELTSRFIPKDLERGNNVSQTPHQETRERPANEVDAIEQRVVGMSHHPRLVKLLLGTGFAAAFVKVLCWVLLRHNKSAVFLSISDAEKEKVPPIADQT